MLSLQLKRWNIHSKNDRRQTRADMILGDLMLEVKASANPTLKRQDLYQVIGYVLLDYHNAYQIRRVGLYLARFGHLVTWTMPECLALLGARRDLAELRKLFAETVALGA